MYGCMFTYNDHDITGWIISATPLGTKSCTCVDTNKLHSILSTLVDTRTYSFYRSQPVDNSCLVWTSIDGLHCTSIGNLKKEVERCV